MSRRDEPKPPTPQERHAAATERIASTLDELAELNRRSDARAEIQRREWEADKLRRREPRGHQSDPRRLSFLTMARALPALAEIFSRKIPGAAWSLDTDTATIACPCANTPEAEKGVPTECGGEGCNRYYLFDGEHVRVGYPAEFTPARRKPQTPAAS